MEAKGDYVHTINKSVEWLIQQPHFGDYPHDQVDRDIRNYRRAGYKNGEILDGYLDHFATAGVTLLHLVHHNHPFLEEVGASEAELRLWLYSWAARGSAFCETVLFNHNIPEYSSRKDSLDKFKEMLKQKSTPNKEVFR